MHVLAFIDWLHVAWRIRTQFLSPLKRLDFGGFLINPGIVRQLKGELGLNDDDLNFSNKQSYEGALKVEWVGCLACYFHAKPNSNLLHMPL